MLADVALGFCLAGLTLCLLSLTWSRRSRPLPQSHALAEEVSAIMRAFEKIPIVFSADKAIRNLGKATTVSVSGLREHFHRLGTWRDR